MTNKRSGNLKKELLPVLLSYLVIVIFLFTGAVSARFIGRSEGGDSSRVAKFGVEISGGSDIPVSLKAGEEATYSFTVRNTSEVAVQYRIELQGLPSGISVSVNDGISYNTMRTLDIGQQKDIVLTFEVGEEVTDGIDQTVKVGIYAEQID